MSDDKSRLASNVSLFFYNNFTNIYTSLIAERIVGCGNKCK